MTHPPAKRPHTKRCDELLQSLIDGITDQLAVLDESGRIMGVNASWRSSPREWLASPDFEVGDCYPECCRARTDVTAPSALALASMVETLLRGEEPQDATLEYGAGEDKETSWFEVRAARLRGPGPARVLIIHRDISRRKEAQQKSEAANRALLDAIPDLLFHLDGRGTYLAYKPSEDFPAVLKPHEFLGRTLAETMPPEVTEKAMDAIRRVLDTGQIQFLEYQLELEGRTRDYEARFVKSGPDEVLSIVRDISARKASEAKLRFQAAFEKMAARVSRRFASLPAEEFGEAVRDGLAEAGQFSQADRVWVAFLALEGDRVQDVYEWVADGEDPRPQRIPLATELLEADQTWLLDCEILSLTGLQKMSGEGEGLARGLQDAGVRSFLGFPLVSSRTVLGFLGLETVDREMEWPEEFEILVRVFSQIFARAQERRRAWEALQQSEVQLRHSQKMEAIGRLAGGVAHDFNNLLTAISGYSALILRGLPPGDPLRKDAQEIQKAAERAAALTSRLLAFGRKQVLQPQPLSLNQLIQDLGRMIRLMTGDEIELEITLDSDLGSIQADPGQIEQVVTNLVVNARDAMPDGGRLTLATANLEVTRPLIREGVEMTPGHYVTLRVSDSGMGMSEETRARIFEPFFTTKMEGTGLGLSTVYGIVKQSGGEIWVDSGEGGGATFTMCLPRSEGVPVPQTEASPSVVRGGTETILLVEDQHAVRPLLRRFLEDAGYEVLEAADGVEALVLAREHQAPVNILVTDVVMPGMSGPELNSQLRRVNPDLKTLFVSGYTQEAIEGQGALREGTGFLQKPFSPDVLVQKIREVLES